MDQPLNNSPSVNVLPPEVRVALARWRRARLRRERRRQLLSLGATLLLALFLTGVALGFSLAAHWPRP